MNFKRKCGPPERMTESHYGTSSDNNGR